MNRFLKTLKAPVTLLAKAEVLAVRYTVNTVGFFAFLPTLGKQTSGRPYATWIGREYEKLVKSVFKKTDQVQMAQLRALRRVGILDADKFTRDSAKEHMSSVSRKGGYAGMIDTIIQFHKEGLHDTLSAARELGQIAQSMNLAYCYQRSPFNGSQEESQKLYFELTDKMTPWVSGHVMEILRTTGDDATDRYHRREVVGLLRSLVLKDSEQIPGVVMPPPHDGRRLMIIFNEKSGLCDKPIVSYDHDRVETVDDAIARLEKIPADGSSEELVNGRRWVNNEWVDLHDQEVVLEQLRYYQKHKSFKAPTL